MWSGFFIFIFVIKFFLKNEREMEVTLWKETYDLLGIPEEIKCLDGWLFGR